MQPWPIDLQRFYLPRKLIRARVVGGDNQCESHIAHGKNQLRRVNALGCIAEPSSRHSLSLPAPLA